MKVREAIENETMTGCLLIGIPAKRVEGRVWAEETQQERTTIRIGTIQPPQRLLRVPEPGVKSCDEKRVYGPAGIYLQKAVQDLLPLVTPPGSRV
jgi:hypothetical protein